MPRAKRNVEQHLREGLERSDDPEVRYHLRQALQALAVLDDSGPNIDDSDFESIP